MSTTLASGYDLVIFDLDGVVYLGDEAVPGAAEAIRSIVDAGVAVAYVTNNASRRAGEIATLLAALGVPARAEEVLTSGAAAALLLAADLPAGAAVLVVGAPALGEEIRAAGLSPVRLAADRPVVVVQGYGTQVGWSDLAEACVAIRAGARWVATNTDATVPTPRGMLPGNGSLVAALSTALAGREPDLVVGKPSPAMFEMAARERAARRVLVVGDRVDTDIEGARRAGMGGLLVLTGVSDATAVLTAAEPQRPTHIGADCWALSTKDDLVRVPAHTAAGGVARSGRWSVAHEDGRLLLREDRGEAGSETGSSGTGSSGTGSETGSAAGTTADRSDQAAAVRALAAVAWAHPGWAEIVAVGERAARVVEALGLTRERGGPPGGSVSPACAT